MNLYDIVRGQRPPLPWTEGDNIPWDDPDFSRRMLSEHLSQEHDAASRRFDKIDRHIDWIHDRLLDERSSKILDLGCGPGLYLQRLARLGHECIGIDFSPASIEYAGRESKKEGLDIDYRLDDIRIASFGGGFDLIMLIYGEFNVFPPGDATRIAENIYTGLNPGGTALLEVHTFEEIRRNGQESSSWYSAEAGLFSKKPHLCLQEHFWAPESRTATRRFYIVDTRGRTVDRYAQSFQAYTDDEYFTLLIRSGFSGVDTFSSLTGDVADREEGYRVLLATK